MFAQVMREMLTPASFESFRAYSLDTTARLDEALQVVGDVRRQRVPKVVLEPILEELEWSFTKDPAVISLARIEIETLNDELKKKKDISIDRVAANLFLIRKNIHYEYKNKLENIILLLLFGTKNNNIELRKAIGFYCSHIVNIGYSRRYILQIVDSLFFDQPIVRARQLTLKKFFRNFDGKKKNFIVHAAVTRDMGKYLSSMNFTVKEIRSISKDQLSALRNNTEFQNLPFAFELKVSEADPYRAMNSCYQFLSAQRAIAYLDPIGMQSKWGETMHVALQKAKSGITVTNSDFLTNQPTIPRQLSKRRAKGLSSYAWAIVDNFNESSNERMLSSIRTASLARTSQNPENQLISLWSAVEVLLSEPQESARIVHYADLICPCVVLRYTRRQVWSLFQNLTIKYRSRLRSIIRDMPGFPEVHGQRAFAELIFLPSHSSFRNELCKMLEGNPLALHRVWKLHNDYANQKCARRTMTDHLNRVRWQIHRIYRARNQLVHSGRMPSYLESLILNLAEYYGAAVATIVHYAKQEQYESHIDHIVAEIGIRHKMQQRKFLSGDGKELTKVLVDDLLDESLLYQV